MITESLKVLLSNHIESAAIVQGYHWNVTGADFVQFHDFFSEVYSEYSGEVDRLAEYVRIVSGGTEYVNATCDLVKLNKTVKADIIVGSEPIKMVNAIVVLNDVLIGGFNDLFSEATKQNEQGLVNYCADRLDSLKKLNWKLKAISK